ncbi:hypothetical protein CspHIS471_0204610 [Cutaneotrichosporon sp. HIS471]|nr:hypothetical protein CspHIS471_0204610 [Cutaneotrichosporon sp. HIS471]
MTNDIFRRLFGRKAKADVSKEYMAESKNAIASEQYLQQPHQAIKPKSQGTPKPQPGQAASYAPREKTLAHANGIGNRTVVPAPSSADAPAITLWSAPSHHDSGHGGHGGYSGGYSGDCSSGGGGDGGGGGGGGGC